jgi:hypothetical protein
MTLDEIIDKYQVKDSGGLSDFQKECLAVDADEVPVKVSTELQNTLDGGGSKVVDYAWCTFATGISDACWDRVLDFFRALKAIGGRELVNSFMAEFVGDNPAGDFGRLRLLLFSTASHMEILDECLTWAKTSKGEDYWRDVWYSL